MVGRRSIVEIKKGNFGMQKRFRLKDYDRSTASGYTVKITIWYLASGVITKIVDLASCTATYDGEDTYVTYIPLAPSPFDDPGDYFAEVNFTKTGYDEDVKTFAWRVIPSSK